MRVQPAQHPGDRVGLVRVVHVGARTAAQGFQGGLRGEIEPVQVDDVQRGPPRLGHHLQIDTAEAEVTLGTDVEAPRRVRQVLADGLAAGHRGPDPCLQLLG